jgi:hypothetical protein
MRFKPRTDLERIFDSLNDSPFYRKLDRDILHRHLAKLTNTQTVKIKNKTKVEEEDDKSQYSLVNSQKSKLTGAASIVAQYVNK